MPKGASTFLQTIMRSIEVSVLQARGIYTWAAGSLPRIPFVVPEIYQAVAAKYKQEGRFGIEFHKALHEGLHHKPVDMFALTEYLALFGDDDACRSLNGLLSKALFDASVQKLVCSHEDFVFGGSRHCTSTEELIQKRNHTLKGLKRLFAGMDVTLVLVIRRQDRLLRSLYSSLVGYHLVTGSFADVCSWFGTLLSYDQLLDVLVGLFGRENLRILFFEDIKEDPHGFVERFLHLIIPSIHLGSDSVLTPVHASLSAEALDIMRYSNSVLRGKYRIGDELLPRCVSPELEQERRALHRALMTFKATEQAHNCAEDVIQKQLCEAFSQSNERLFETHIPTDHPCQKWRAYYQFA